MSLIFLVVLSALPDGEFWVRRDASCEKLEVRGVMVKLGDVIFNQRDGRLFAPTLKNGLSQQCTVETPTTGRFETKDACLAASEPFRLSGCDGALTELNELDALVRATDDVTVDRLNAIIKKGGRVWERNSCSPVTVKTNKRGTTLRGADWETQGVFEPRLGRARLSGTQVWSDGGLGLRGTGAITEPLLLGHGLFILGSRVLYVDEGVCVAQRKKL